MYNQVFIFERIFATGTPAQFAINDSGVIFRRFWVRAVHQHRVRKDGSPALPGRWGKWEVLYSGAVGNAEMYLSTFARKTNRIAIVRSGPINKVIRACQR